VIVHPHPFALPELREDLGRTRRSQRLPQGIKTNENRYFIVESSNENESTHS
jgi:hypothetical protein